MMLLAVRVELASAGVEPEDRESAPRALSKPDSQGCPDKWRQWLVMNTCSDEEREYERDVKDVENGVELGADWRYG